MCREKFCPRQIFVPVRWNLTDVWLTERETQKKEISLLMMKTHWSKTFFQTENAFFLHLMATSVSASFPTTGDLSPQRLLQRPSQPQQSIVPLRRERTSIDGDSYRNRLNHLYYSHDVSGKSAAFSGGKTIETISFNFSRRSNVEKQYERRQASSQVRSAKSDEVKKEKISFSNRFSTVFFLFVFEVFRLIDRRLQTGVHGVRHMFRSNDPNREGKLSK